MALGRMDSALRSFLARAVPGSSSSGSNQSRQNNNNTRRFTGANDNDHREDFSGSSKGASSQSRHNTTTTTTRNFTGGNEDDHREVGSTSGQPYDGLVNGEQERGVAVNESCLFVVPEGMRSLCGRFTSATTSTKSPQDIIREILCVLGETSVACSLKGYVFGVN